MLKSLMLTLQIISSNETLNFQARFFFLLGRKKNLSHQDIFLNNEKTSVDSNTKMELSDKDFKGTIIQMIFNKQLQTHEISGGERKERSQQRNKRYKESYEYLRMTKFNRNRNSMEELNNRMVGAEERISELKYRIVDIAKHEQKKENKLQGGKL